MMHRRDLLKKLGIGAAALPMAQIVTSLAKAEDSDAIAKAKQEGLVSKKTVSSAIGFDYTSLPGGISSKYSWMGVDQICGGLEYFITNIGGWSHTGTVVNFRDLDILMRDHQVVNCVIDANPLITQACLFARRFPGYVTLCQYASIESDLFKTAGFMSGGHVVPLVHARRDYWYATNYKAYGTAYSHAEAYCRIASHLRTHELSVKGLIRLENQKQM